jgi:hypothetical protein
MTSISGTSPAPAIDRPHRTTVRAGGGPLGIDLGFPQAVQITKFSGTHLNGICLENRFRRGPGGKKLNVSFPIRYKFDPLDVMLFFHGMSHAADLDLKPSGNFFDDRDVLFLGGVNGVLFEQNHRLSAADQFAAAPMQHLDNITT